MHSITAKFTYPEFNVDNSPCRQLRGASLLARRPGSDEYLTIATVIFPNDKFENIKFNKSGDWPVCVVIHGHTRDSTPSPVAVIPVDVSVPSAPGAITITIDPCDS